MPQEGEGSAAMPTWVKNDALLKVLWKCRAFSSSSHAVQHGQAQDRMAPSRTNWLFQRLSRYDGLIPCSFSFRRTVAVVPLGDMLIVVGSRSCLMWRHVICAPSDLTEVNSGGRASDRRKMFKICVSPRLWMRCPRCHILHMAIWLEVACLKRWTPGEHL